MRSRRSSVLVVVVGRRRRRASGTGDERGKDELLKDRRGKMGKGRRSWSNLILLLDLKSLHQSSPTVLHLREILL